VNPWMKRTLAGLACAVFAFGILETICRVEWSHRSETPFFSPNLYFYYPELAPVLEADTDSDHGMDVLLLGGSVLHEDWGSIPQNLREVLTLAGRKDVRIHNLAKPGHTSLDSLYKYRRLEGKSFDLVLFYHGINELRLNNCPRHIFQPDYGHSSWYRVINRFERNGRRPNLASLYALTYRFVRLHEKLIAPEAYVPRERPDPKAMRFGGEIKTAPSFQSNLEGILALAQERKEPVVLMTFCYHLPRDYTLERFKAGSLDYCLHSCAVEIWGMPEHIQKGLDVHNRVIRDTWDRHRGNAIFVDQALHMPRDQEHFNDICHLTHKGCTAFTEHILRETRGLLHHRPTQEEPGLQ
jgi:hypothetical protein